MKQVVAQGPSFQQAHSSVLLLHSAVEQLAVADAVEGEFCLMAGGVGDRQIPLVGHPNFETGERSLCPERADTGVHRLHEMIDSEYGESSVTL
jgi:hypothetical protein